MKTPVSKAGLKMYDHLPPEEAVKKAWNNGGGHLRWHNQMKKEVRERMPILARALDRIK